MSAERIRQCSQETLQHSRRTPRRRRWRCSGSIATWRFVMGDRAQVRVEMVENAGPNTLASFLRNAGSMASGVNIASAFVTSAGLGLVAYMLKQAAVKGQVRILSGLYQGF